MQGTSVACKHCFSHDGPPPTFPPSFALSVGCPCCRVCFAPGAPPAEPLKRIPFVLPPAVPPHAPRPDFCTLSAAPREERSRKQRCHHTHKHNGPRERNTTTRCTRRGTRFLFLSLSLSLSFLSLSYDTQSAARRCVWSVSTARRRRRDSTGSDMQKSIPVPARVAAAGLRG